MAILWKLKQRIENRYDEKSRNAYARVVEYGDSCLPPSQTDVLTMTSVFNHCDVKGFDMKRFASGLLACSLLACPLALTGCGSSTDNEVMDFDEEESKKQGDAYQKEMEEAMKNAGQMPQ